MAAIPSARLPDSQICQHQSVKKKTTAMKITEISTTRTEDKPSVIWVQVHTDEGITFDLDNSGYGLKVESTVKMASADSTTTCKMKRP